jgi:hypothetical protein
MRVLSLFLLCVHLASGTSALQALDSVCAEDEVSAGACGCPGDAPDSEEPCSENCGGCVRCPVASDLPAPVTQLSPFELPQHRTAVLESLLPSRLQARNVFRPPRALPGFSV